MHNHVFKPLLVIIALLLQATCIAAESAEVEWQVTKLDKLVGLAPEQRIKATEIFQRERASLSAPRKNEPSAMQKNLEVRKRARVEIRAVLTPAQARVYDRTRTGMGGGLTLAEPESRVAELDKQLGLTPEQKAAALLVYKEEFESLVAIAPDDRAQGGAPYRATASNQIRAILTPEQLAKQKSIWDAKALEHSELTLALTNALRASPAVTARVGSGASYTPVRTAELSGPPIKGEGVFKATGGNGPAWFTVKWERADQGAPITIVGIAETSAEEPKS